MDWNKMGAVSSFGSFVIAGIVFCVQIWPWPQIKASSSSASVLPLNGNRTIAMFLVIGFVLAGITLFRTKNAGRPLAHQGPPFIQFFQNRISLDRARGTIIDELQRYGETFWVMWQVGHLVPQMEKNVQAKIHRMIIGNPNSPIEALEHWARAANAGNGETIRSRILETARLATLSGVPVKYTNEQSISIVIANPNSTNNSGWVRIEYILPFLHPACRPSFVFEQKDFPEAFKNFVRAYDDVWADAIKP
jgi:hypothetical protein